MGFFKDIFKTKSLAEQLNDAYSGQNSTGDIVGNHYKAAAAASSNSQAALGSQSSSGSAAGTVGITTTTTTAGTTITLPNMYNPGQLSQIFTSLGIGLTKEEEKELEELKKDHKIKLKTKRLSIFKALPAEIRQLIVNVCEWNACCQAMKNTEEEKSDRLKELESKQFGNGLYIGSGSLNITTAVNPYWYITPEIQLPEDVTVEDIKKAHMEASLEEEVLKDESNT